MTAREDEPRYEPVSRVSRVLRAIVLTMVLLVVASVALVGVQFGIRFWQHLTFLQELGHLQRTLEPWRQNPPPDVDANAWREASGFITKTAVHNILLSPDTTTVAEMRRLRHDVEVKMSEGPAGVEHLDWLWHRLGQTGPSGVRYTTQKQPMWDEVKGWLRPPPADPPHSISHPLEGN
jgi:hypothetical protein